MKWLAFGVVLLELGLWQTVAEVRGVNLIGTIASSAVGEAPRKIGEKLIRQAGGRLGHKCGDKFRDVTLKCLRAGAGDLGPIGSDSDSVNAGLGKRYQEMVLEPLALLANTV